MSSGFTVHPFSKNFSPVIPIAIAPSGAVNSIDRTAMARIISPDLTPAASGTAPIAAWTVAFGQRRLLINYLAAELRGINP